MKQLIALLSIVALLNAGCMTMPDGSTKFDSAKAQQIALSVVANTLLAAAQQKINGGDFDKAWALSAGMNSISTIVRSLDNSQAAALIQGTSVQFANNDPKFMTLATKLADAYLAASPKTPSEKTAAVVAIGVGTQLGTQKAVNVLQ